MAWRAGARVVVLLFHFAALRVDAGRRGAAWSGGSANLFVKSETGLIQGMHMGRGNRAGNDETMLELGETDSADATRRRRRHRRKTTPAPTPAPTDKSTPAPTDKPRPKPVTPTMQSNKHLDSATELSDYVNSLIKSGHSKTCQDFGKKLHESYNRLKDVEFTDRRRRGRGGCHMPVMVENSGGAKKDKAEGAACFDEYFKAAGGKKDASGTLLKSGRPYTAYYQPDKSQDTFISEGFYGLYERGGDPEKGEYHVFMHKVVCCDKSTAGDVGNKCILRSVSVCHKCSKPNKADDVIRGSGECSIADCTDHKAFEMLGAVVST